MGGKIEANDVKIPIPGTSESPEKDPFIRLLQMVEMWKERFETQILISTIYHLLL